MSRITVHGAPEGFDALLIARRRAEHGGAVLHVARDDGRLDRLAEALAFFAPDIEVLRFPAWDCLPYDRVSPRPAIQAERLATLSRLLEPPSGQPVLVLTTANALVQRTPPPGALLGASLALASGCSVDVSALSAFLEQHGYQRAGSVMEPGDYAVRGGIIDIFPAGMAEPVRLDLFGEVIDSLRSFDPATQRSAAAIARVTLRPITEIALDEAARSRFRTGWRDLFGPAAAEDPIYRAVSEGRRHPGLEHYAPLFQPQMATLFDYLPDVSVSLDSQTPQALTARFEMIADHYAARRTPVRAGELPYRPLPPEQLYLDQSQCDALLDEVPCFLFSPFGQPEGAPGIDAGGRAAPIFAASSPRESGGAFAELARQAAGWRAGGRQVTVAAWTRGSRARLANLLHEAGLATQEVESWQEVLHPKTTRGQAPALPLMILGLERGFLADGLAVVCEQDLLGERMQRPARRRKRAEEVIAAATEIVEGDLVVHQDHGIGRYDGLVTLEVSGAPHDCLRLIYDGGDKLFLPVENIEMLSRFGEAGAGVALDRLGGTSWQARKARAKTRIREMAGELIRLAATRQLREAPIIAPPEGSWDEFCARFPHAETEDQAHAIADVIEDLAGGQPMDRLICGDVGFGKTEVALRAAFIVAMSGAQVAVVVPTTLLARQHMRTFTARFAGFPVRIAQLSRLVSARDAALVKQQLAAGEVQIVIGTHALLSKTISFADLGLLIIDEEQHFGVSHKERLKQLKTDVHVLTLTATPIPRTLQLALSGLRQMSLITTPPIDRLAVRTFIMPFDPLVVREAIQRERFRGGQIFCVAPRIEDLSKLAERLAEIVPEARIVQAHGRMGATDLERAMAAFGDGAYDILLATNIVESGLDMPAVNTLIIHRADLFGLGQLYQLRGRVGRGKQRGYAYLTWPQTHVLSASAQKRLEVMQTLDSLGAGFTLASHDLDLRGAGNLLGEEQSGQIREVGIELYQSMLQEAVTELRAQRGKEKVAEGWTPSIGLGLPVLIPEEYVRDLPVRLGLYRRIGGLTDDAESEALAAELVDRFGALPAEVENLLQVMALKRLCRSAGVEKLEAGPKGMVLSFHDNRFGNPAGLVAWLGTQSGMVRLRPDHKLAIVREMNLPLRLRTARETLLTLSDLLLRARAA